MRIRTVHSCDHRGRTEFRPYVDGQHAILLECDDGSSGGELVWRLANIGQGIAEISGFGIEGSLRRMGWGSRLLDTALQDIRAFMLAHGISPRLVYLFSAEGNQPAAAFYEARGFRKLSSVPGLFATSSACVLAHDLTIDPSPALESSEVSLERLARTDLPSPDDPAMTETPFGFLVTRMQESSLQNCICTSETTDACIETLRSGAAKKATGYDQVTLDLLWRRLESQGWSRGGLLMMVLSEPPEIHINPDIEIEVIDPARLACTPSYRRLLEEDDALITGRWRSIRNGGLEARSSSRGSMAVRQGAVGGT